MNRQRTRWTRGVVTLAILGVIAGAVVASPVGAAGTLTKQKVKKIATKVAGNLLAARSLWAVVEANGSLVGGSGATSSVKIGTGAYNVTFNRDVAACAVEVTPRIAGVPRFEKPVTWAGPVPGNPTVISVGSADTSEASIDLSFSLAVHC